MLSIHEAPDFRPRLETVALYGSRLLAQLRYLTLDHEVNFVRRGLRVGKLSGQIERLSMRLLSSALAAIAVLALSSPSLAQRLEDSWLMPTRGCVSASPRPQVIGSKAVLELLERKYPEVVLAPRTRATTSPHLAYRKDVERFLSLARQGLVERQAVIQKFRILHGEAKELETLLSTLVPDVLYRSNGRDLYAMSQAGGLDLVEVLLEEIDLPKDSVLIDVKLVELTPQGLQNAGFGWYPPAEVTETVTEAVNGQRLEQRRENGLFHAGYTTRGCR